MELVRSLDKSVQIATRSWNLNNIQKSANDKGDIIHILFAHATGFSKESWEPIINRLNDNGYKVTN